MRLPAALSAALATACLSFMVLAAEAAAEPIGQVIEQTGAAFVIHEGRVSPLGPGRNLDDADRIVTAGDGKVAIRFEDGSLCTIGPGSELLIGDLASPSGGWIDLVRGIVRVILAPGARAGASGVRTRAAVASVRSTEFVVEASLDRAAVFVASGTVEVTGRLTGATVTLGPGEGTDIGLREPPTPVKRWGDKRVADAMARTTIP
jgi:hypothetical protein